MRYEIMTEMNTWLEVSESDLIELRSFFPEMVIRVTNNGEDVTAEFIKTMRCILIYG